MLVYTFYEHDNRIMRYSEALAARGDSVDVITLRQPGQPPLSFADTLRNHRITRKRMIVEGVFGSWKRWCGWRKTRLMVLARNELTVCLMALAWNLKKWVKLSTPRLSHA